MHTMVNLAGTYETWRILDLSYASASQNLALEEALVQDDLSEDFTPTIRVWINPPAAVIGRFQDVKSEVDMKFCEQNQIQIVRRFTGGGAVYHDEGNLNFTIVMPKPESVGLLEFHKINALIIQDCLSGLGLISEFTPPNSVEIAGKKISGAAAGFYRKQSLWHASILISTDIVTATHVLSPSRRNFEATHVRSRWKPVTTLEASLGKYVPLDEVKTCLLRSFEKLNGARLQSLPLSDAETKRMHNLLLSKYSNYEWNHLGTWSEG